MRRVEMRRVKQARARLMAKDAYGSTNVEVDDVLTDEDFSQGADGCWVRAWVWLPNVEVTDGE